VTNLPAISSGISTGVPDMGAALLRVFGALGVVIALFLAGVWMFKNWQRLALRKGASPKLNVLEVKSLGQRQALYVVGYEQQRMLIASSPAGIALVSHLPEAGAGPAESAPSVTFVEAFQQVLNRKP
jgi:flagellar biogenesis protein FliO